MRGPESVERLLARFYPPGQLAPSEFYGWMLDSLTPAAVVLNVGAGGASVGLTRRVRDSAGRLVGVDVDPAVLANPDLAEAHVSDGVHLPYDDDTFDAVYSDWTMEHVERPDLLLREIHRVLKPGCSYWFRTTNLRHYVTVVSAVTPHWFHTWLLSAIGSKPDGGPWPTYYRVNTPSRARKLLDEAGYRDSELRMVETYPTYLTFSRIPFLIGVLYERTVNRTPRLSGFRLILNARATKGPATDSS